VPRSLAPLPYEPGLLEHPKVLRDCGTADGKPARDLDDWLRPASEPFEDRSARRIRKRCDRICVSHYLP
jgi:hypothetical protein